jgi:hypothetical protein
LLALIKWIDHERKRSQSASTAKPEITADGRRVVADKDLYALGHR